MSARKELFVNATELLRIDDRTNIPTVVLYGRGSCRIGYDAIEACESATELNEDFKVELGKQDPSVINRRKFSTGAGDTRSAHALTKDFIDTALSYVDQLTQARGLVAAKRILVAEPIAMNESDETGTTELYLNT